MLLCFLAGLRPPEWSAGVSEKTPWVTPDEHNCSWERDTCLYRRCHQAGRGMLRSRALRPHGAEDPAQAVTDNPRPALIVLITVSIPVSESAVIAQACLSQLEIHLGKDSILAGHFPPGFSNSVKGTRPSGKCPPVVALLPESV